jgi:hypothetical protein
VAEEIVHLAKDLGHHHVRRIPYSSYSVINKNTKPSSSSSKSVRGVRTLSGHSLLSYFILT